MSSSTGLGRTRSLRKPASRGSELGQKESTTTRNEARVVSPSRLPSRKLDYRQTSLGSILQQIVDQSRRQCHLRDHKALRQGRLHASSAAVDDNIYSSVEPHSQHHPTEVFRRAIFDSSTKRAAIGTFTREIDRHEPYRRNNSPPTIPPLDNKLDLDTHFRDINETANPLTDARAHAVPIRDPNTTTTTPFPQTPQHYSPAKTHAPKPLTSTFLAPPSPSKLPTNVAISAETSRLQAELLQLSLLHRDAGAVDAEWHASARHKLGARFKRLARDEEGVRALEREGVEARGLGALVRWGGGGDDGRGGGKNTRGMGLDEKVQILDQVLTGVWTLSEPEGRYQRTGRAFEIWANRMAAILDAQRSGDIDALVQGDEVLFLSELDKTWKRDCAGLVRKLDSWRRALRELGDVEEAGDGQQQQQRSGLARAVGGCRSLVHDMLAELSVMEQIELDATRAEDEWIERMNTELTHDDTQREDVPLWKLLI
ncbi:Uu.00g059420.m01.CDS01 [Anthostomella pinea]|uniref:Uu.00g059420.m01.CDS01 n=1 Tax=Anthostomella pinea TaxID=933095 RepID=A0AAI8VS27_9PEZI|nr:Uu.00g059420.m01.CDS01 [Anthostomella pinea]